MAARKTPTMKKLGRRFPIAAATLGERGNIGCINTAGYLVQGTDATADLQCVGKIIDTVDNTEGADGALYAEVECGEAYGWTNGTGADEVTIADVGGTAYIAGPGTVARVATGGRSPAGEIYQVAPEGVFVLPTLRD